LLLPEFIVLHLMLLKLFELQLLLLELPMMQFLLLEHADAAVAVVGADMMLRLLLL
jgi:hypothetical protein